MITKLKCSTCGKMRSLSKFGRRSNRPISGKRLGLHSRCSDCWKDYRRKPEVRKTTRNKSLAWKNKIRTEYPLRWRRRMKNQNLRRLYRITMVEYEGLLASQNGVCAVCGKKPNNTLNVDHCHITGKVRGLLCNGCNTGMGGFRDDVGLLKNAIKYLNQLK